MSATTPIQSRTLRSILRNGTTPRATLRISIPSAAATTPATALDDSNHLANENPNYNTPLPSPPLPPPPPPNTPTVRFAVQPRHRPSKRRARRALHALPYNGALRPKRRQIPDDAHNALSIVDQAERDELRRKRHSSSCDLEKAALAALELWGPLVLDRGVWDENSVEPDDSTRRGRRLRQPEVV
ncbi:hypothetical protein K466DRAFT_404513 [Polyporus arcularius HHB13444]|uniref:Uncharacterized protein n=1 Tax=Polyporus arcularius HHB13444 TaxID=1314778 RepID=A0A5C3PM22_9APHY|nr:hypothetical protein K466DRAFT_404513 [Polyporus arcularius HHB13444]